MVAVPAETPVTVVNTAGPVTTVATAGLLLLQVPAVDMESPVKTRVLPTQHPGVPDMVAKEANENNRARRVNVNCFFINFVWWLKIFGRYAQKY